MRSVMGALANYAVQQSPYPRPENLEIVLDAFYQSIKDDFDEGKKYVKFFESWKEAHDYIENRLKMIPEFMAWNERKNGRQGNGATFAGHHDDGSVTISKTNPDDDFIDLYALTRNITNQALNR